MEEPVKIIKGNYYKTGGVYDKTGDKTGDKKRIKGKAGKKTIAFDFDETIGHFKHLKMIYQCFQSLSQHEFNALLDIFPEFLRPGIMAIMEFLAKKKKSGYICKLCIYTNNQSNGDWVQMVANYIQAKTDCPKLFDDIIKAFKQGNKIIEMRRTTRSKTYADYVSCIMLPEDTIETCFIDDRYYEKMLGDRVYYILPNAYYHKLSKATMIKRIMSCSAFKYFPHLEMTLVNKLSDNEYANSGLTFEQEIAITKKIMYYVREYLYYPKLPSANTTRRKSKHKHRSTYKIEINHKL